MKLGPTDCLLVIDVQHDFLPGGSLAVPDGDAILPGIRSLMIDSKDYGACVVVTQDWHPPGHWSFASTHSRAPFEQIERCATLQTLWPDHCVQGSRGAEIHESIPTDIASIFLRKGCNLNVDSYSAFRENIDHKGERVPTGLAKMLKARNVKTVYCVGLAADYCVKWSAIDASEAGFRSIILKDLTRAVDPDYKLEGKTSAELFMHHQVFVATSEES